MGQDNVAGMVTHYWVDGPGMESRWRRDIPYPSRPVSPPTQPHVEWVPGHSPGVMRPARGTNHPSPSSAEGKERVVLYVYSPSMSSRRVIEWICLLRLYVLRQMVDDLRLVSRIKTRGTIPPFPHMPS